MNRVICAVLLALMPVLTAAAAEPRIPAAKKKLILKLFEVTDAKDNTTDAIIDILGAVFDEISAMLITLPFVLPVIVKLGYDPVWWGIINVVVIELGMIIPPIGVIVFLLHGLAREIPMRTIYRGVAPFIFADLVLLALLAVFPAIALWLPRLLGS